MPEILIYSATFCPYCIMAKKLFEKKEVEYTEINIDTKPEFRREMMQKTQRRTVPQIFIGDKHIGGFDDLHALERKNELNPLLKDFYKKTKTEQ